MAVLVSQSKNNFDARCLSNIVYSFSEVRARSPNDFVFDSLLSDLELPLVKKLLESEVDS